MIVVVGGVAGSGKTTVGALLAGRLHWRFADADTFHPQANIDKMRSGVPLTDSDRGPWLDAINAWMAERIEAGESAVAGCSALKQSYRDRLLTGRPTARMVFLEISRELAHARLVARHGHFFTVRLLDSQFTELEPPRESRQLLILDAATGTPDRLADEIIDRLGLVASPPAMSQPDGGRPDGSADRETMEGPVSNAQKARGTAASLPEAEVYRAARQEKPWGHELIFAAVDGKYVGKVIHVNAGHSLSLQYHREKEETISVLSGEAMIQHGPSADRLTGQRFGAGDTIHLPAGVLHRITAISDLDFAEASTAQPGWREDVVRLDDRYGRAGTSAP